MKGSVMIFIEQYEGEIAPVSLELLSKGRELATELGVSLCAAAPGFGLVPKLSALGKYGAATVYAVNHERLRHFTALPYAKVVTRLIEKYKPQVVLFGATTTGRALAPRVASALRCGLTADCTGLEIGEFESRNTKYKDKLIQIRPAFGGNIIATIVSPESFPSMATVREGVMPLSELKPWSEAEVIEEPCFLAVEDSLTEVIDVIHRERTVNLKGARIIVSAGMGASGVSSLHMVRELAKVLGAELGCSRPMVDTGILAKDHQVGQTGVTVRPNLYIACGISGQIQHRAGMAESKRIIAINRDPDAPIFSIANYGIVGDLNEVIPRLIKAYRQKV